MDELEQQCEDALFELCDARERYPLRCADELQKCIKLKNDMNMMEVSHKPNATDKSLISEHPARFKSDFNETEMYFEHLDCKLQDFINKLDNLKAVIEQIEREKICEINKLLKG